MRTVDIHELPATRRDGKGWIMRGRKFTTAAGALRAVRREDRETAKRSGKAVTLVNWHPQTHAGRLIVKALTT